MSKALAKPAEDESPSTHLHKAVKHLQSCSCQQAPTIPDVNNAVDLIR